MATAALISGPIASGKSTVAQALHRSWPGSVLLDGDDHDAPDGISLQARWTYALWRLSERLRHDLAEGRNAVVAWPLTEAHYNHLQEVSTDAGADVFCVTLCPPLDVALTGRVAPLSPGNGSACALCTPRAMRHARSATFCSTAPRWILRRARGRSC